MQANNNQSVEAIPNYSCSECGRDYQGAPAEAMTVGDKIMSLMDERKEGRIRDILARYGLRFPHSHETYYMCPECKVSSSLESEND